MKLNGKEKGEEGTKVLLLLNLKPRIVELLRFDSSFDG